jgi:hypothetical protein
MIGMSIQLRVVEKNVSLEDGDSLALSLDSDSVFGKLKRFSPTLFFFTYIE